MNGLHYKYLYKYTIIQILKSEYFLIRVILRYLVKSQWSNTFYENLKKDQ